MARKSVRVYQGKEIEKGATSIKGKGPAPAIRWMVKEGIIKKGMKVLDYGAGKYARNADYLRELGCKVYAYDPHNYNTTGRVWTLGAVSNQEPRGMFDIAFTSYVLNVVPLKVEKEIIRKLSNHSYTLAHVVRGSSGLIDMAIRALSYESNNEYIRSWYRAKFFRYKDSYHYADVCEFAVHNSSLVREFCHFGVQTGKDKFQRAVNEDLMKARKYKQLRTTNSYVLYYKEK